MNDPQFRNMAQNMNNDTMRNMMKNIEYMNDDQLKSMMNMAGVGHMDVNTFKQMSKNMANSNDDTLNNMKRSASSFSPNNTNSYPSNQPRSENTQPNINKSKSVKFDDNFINQAFKKSNKIIELEEIKNKGNELFRQKKYKEAKEKYYEILNSLDEEHIKIEEREETKTIINTTRLNISNCLLKLEEYELAIYECLKVLKETETFKVHYRLGNAYFCKKNYEKAEFHFNSSLKFAITNDETNSSKEFLNKLIELKPKPKEDIPIKEEVKCSNTEKNLKEEKKIIEKEDILIEETVSKTNLKEEKVVDSEFYSKNKEKIEESKKQFENMVSLCYH